MHWNPIYRYQNPRLRLLHTRDETPRAQICRYSYPDTISTRCRLHRPSTISPRSGAMPSRETAVDFQGDLLFTDNRQQICRGPPGRPRRLGATAGGRSLGKRRRTHGHGVPYLHVLSPRCTLPSISLPDAVPPSLSTLFPRGGVLAASRLATSSRCTFDRSPLWICSHVRGILLSALLFALLAGARTTCHVAGREPDAVRRIVVSECECTFPRYLCRCISAADALFLLY
ncbi:hypothetical protein LXA43DRAFT_105785 [Ganoderma leucocontextum]|nr:hypothetical protein LXA43DRAFT_105785 [Ganoderma leucocontextum]